MIRRREATFAGRPVSVPKVRRFVLRALAGVPDEIADDAVVAASELATNAVRHSASGRPRGQFEVIAEITGDRVRIAVVDQGGPTEPVILPPGPGRVGGWGLPIIAQTGSLHVSGDQSGRCVAACFPLPAAAAARLAMATRAQALRVAVAVTFFVVGAVVTMSALAGGDWPARLALLISGLAAAPLLGARSYIDVQEGAAR